MGLCNSKGDRGSSSQSDGSDSTSAGRKGNKPFDPTRSRGKELFASTSDHQLSKKQTKELARLHRSKFDKNSLGCTLTTYNKEGDKIPICQTAVNQEGAVIRLKLMRLGSEISFPKGLSLSAEDVHWDHYRSIMDKHYKSNPKSLKEIILDPLTVTPDHLTNLSANPDSGSKDIPISQNDSLYTTITDNEHYKVAQEMLRKYNPSEVGEIKVKIINSEQGLIKVTLDLKKEEGEAS